MGQARKIILTILAGVLAAGCSGTIFRTFSIDETPPKSISLDARQRLVIITPKGGPVQDSKGNPLKQHRVVCAEPSPDAFMALAASGGANLAFGGKEAGGYGSIAETAGALGLRTQTIQLMRDTLYRSCEAYMNGVIDKGEYRKILAAFDEILITLVAVEGLGRPNTGPLPQIGGQVTYSEEEGKTKTTVDTRVRPAQGTSSTPPLDPVAAKTIHEIVKDYYCFQLGMKQMFYSDYAKHLKKPVQDALCGSNPSE